MSVFTTITTASFDYLTTITTHMYLHLGSERTTGWHVDVKRRERKEREVDKNGDTRADAAEKRAWRAWCR